jgi:hypothetical protein
MKIHRNYSLVIFFVLSIACTNAVSTNKSRTDTLFYENGAIEQIQRRENRKLNGYSEVYLNNGTIKQKKHFISDTAFGPMMEYFPNTRIKRFTYLVKDDVYTYAKEYDSAGTLKKEEGNPLVWYKFSKSLNNDTLLFRFLFCTFNLDSLQVELSSDALHYKNMPLSDYHVDQTKQLKGWKRIRDLDRTSFYIKMRGYENGTVRMYNDTLTFEK